MSQFYTSVERFGNKILCRGYRNGKSFSNRVDFSPTLFIPTRDETEYRTLIGEKPVTPMTFDSMSEAKDFVNQYKDVGNFEVFGTTNYVTQYIQQNYPNPIKFDPSLINIFSFDIEVDISAYEYSGHNKIKVRKKQK
jgi:hypothetical protein